MKTIEPDAIPADVLADLEAFAAALSAGRKPAAELARRVRERAGRATAAIFECCGELNIAVDLIRQTRDDE